MRCKVEEMFKFDLTECITRQTNDISERYGFIISNFKLA